VFTSRLISSLLAQPQLLTFSLAIQHGTWIRNAALQERYEDRKKLKKKRKEKKCSSSLSGQLCPTSSAISTGKKVWCAVAKARRKGRGWEGLVTGQLLGLLCATNKMGDFRTRQSLDPCLIQKASGTDKMNIHRDPCHPMLRKP
jgi:hypothetical protein